MYVRLHRDKLKSLPDLEKTTETVVKAAVACELPVLEKLFVQMEQESPEGYDLLVRRRNQQWLGKLETFLQQEGVFFIVVGLGHLLGPENVLHLLAERGYAVEQF